MKKSSLFVSVLLALCALFAFTGCSELPDSAKPDASEVAASVPQEIEEYLSDEWRLYEEAKELDGYAGTFMEFLQDIGFTATDDSASVNYALTSVVCVESVFGSGSGATGSLGAGVIYSLDTAVGNAFVITNYHVIYGKNKIGQYGIAKKISVYLYGGYGSSRAISASFYGGEMEQDIAVLAVKNASALKETESNTVYARAASFGGAVTVGERVYAIGNPAGEGFSVTGGVVSVPEEKIQVTRADDEKNITISAIRIDAKINHGNSGGGLFNAKGELVGIVSARSEDEDSVGFAIPVATVSKVLGHLGM